MSQAPAPPSPRQARSRGASHAAPATAVPIAVRTADPLPLPIDVWRLILARLHPLALAAAARVSTLWRHRVVTYLATSGEHHLSTTHQHRLVPLDVGLVTDEPPCFTAVMGFAPHTGHLWCLGSTGPRAPQSILEMDRSLRPVRATAVPMATLPEPHHGVGCYGGAVSFDRQEALLLLRTSTLKYPYTVYVYYLLTVSLTTLDAFAPHEAVTVRYPELDSPYVEARYALLFTSQFALLAQVQGVREFALVFPRSPTGAYLKRHQILPYTTLLSAATLAADRFLTITDDDGGGGETQPHTARVWCVSGDSVTQVRTFRLQSQPGATLSCNAVVQGPFLHVYLNNQQAALHWTGGLIAIRSPVTLDPDEEYSFVHVRDDGLVLVEVRRVDLLSVVVGLAEFRLLMAEW